MLAALTLLGLLFLLLHEGLTLGRRVWERVPQRGGERLELVEGGQALIRQLIRRTYPEHRNGVVPFQGGPVGLEVVTATPPLLGGTGRITASLALTRGGHLELAWLPHTERRRTAVPQRAILLSGVAELEMTYFGISAEDLSPRWHPAWRNQPRQPLLVRIRLGFPAGDTRIWPDLMVAPLIDTDAECLPNPEGLRCAGRT
jgi:general secretion pathway protein J